jgi:hypothetical protein
MLYELERGRGGIDAIETYQSALLQHNPGVGMVLQEQKF